VLGELRDRLVDQLQCLGDEQASLGPSSLGRKTTSAPSTGHSSVKRLRSTAGSNRSSSLPPSAENELRPVFALSVRDRRVGHFGTSRLTDAPLEALDPAQRAEPGLLYDLLSHSTARDVAPADACHRGITLSAAPEGRASD